MNITERETSTRNLGQRMLIPVPHSPRPSPDGRCAALTPLLQPCSFGIRPTAMGWPLLTSGSRMCFKQILLTGVGQFSTPKVGQFSKPIDTPPYASPEDCRAAKSFANKKSFMILQLFGYLSSSWQGCSAVSPWHSMICSGVHPSGFPTSFSGFSQQHLHINCLLSGQHITS